MPAVEQSGLAVVGDDLCGERSGSAGRGSHMTRTKTINRPRTRKAILVTQSHGALHEVRAVRRARRL